MNFRIIFLFLASVLLFTIVGCNSDSNLPDLSNVNVDPVQIKRFERELFKSDRQDLDSSIFNLVDEFWPFFQSVILDSSYLNEVSKFISDPALQRIYTETVKKFPDLSEVEMDLYKLFQYYKFYFPNRQSPDVYTYLSELNYDFPVKKIDSALIISLDMYLGQDFPAYSALGIPKYMSRFYIPESINIDCAHELIYPFVKVKRLDRSLLDELLDQGKVLYAVSRLLPETEDSLIIKYTTDQLKWCNDYEGHIWNHLISEDLLFSTDNILVKPYISEGPFTSAFSKSSPGRIAWWTGWQMVKKYMQKNPNISLKELLAETDAQKVLQESAYKPR